MGENADDISLAKLPPQDLDAEQCVLGACLVEYDAIDAVRDILRPDDFYRSRHGVIFAAMLGMREAGEAIDLITLPDVLRRNGQIEKTGGVSYLAELISLVPTAANIRHHAKIVSAAKQLRDVNHACLEAQARVYNRDDPDKVITDLIAKLNDVRRNDGSELITRRDLIMYGYSETETRYEQQGRLSGIPTDFRELDLLLDGLQPGDLVIVAGRPSMGKSAFAECLAENVAGHFVREAKAAGKTSDQADKVGFISIEMNKRQLAVRALSRAGGVSNTKIRRGELSTNEWDRLAAGAGHAIELPILYETSASADADVERTIDTMVQRHGCRLAVLDYLQLMASEEHNNGNREREVSKQSKMLKRKAKQHNIPVIALAQLNRSLENRPDKRPVLADLRESGSLEQDGDVVMFLYREEVYRKCECPWDSECLCGRRGKAEILIRKQRMGPCGEVQLRWEGRTTTFS